MTSSCAAALGAVWDDAGERRALYNSRVSNVIIADGSCEGERGGVCASGARPCGNTRPIRRDGETAEHSILAADTTEKGKKERKRRGRTRWDA